MQRSQQYQKQQKKPRHAKSLITEQTSLCPAKKPLKTMGRFTSSLSKISQQQIFVVDNLMANLFGLPAIIALHLVTRSRTDAIQTETFKNKSWLQRFLKVFNGLGYVSGHYTIQLLYVCSDATPQASINFLSQAYPFTTTSTSHR